MKQLVWNRLASNLLGSGMGVGVRYTNSELLQTWIDDELEQEVVLMFHGEVVDGLLLKKLEVERPLPKKVRKSMLKEAMIQAKKKARKESKKESKQGSKKESKQGSKQESKKESKKGSKKKSI